MSHAEHHSVGVTGWRRAAVLGANDGIVSTASLVLGVAAAQPDTMVILTAGLAGLLGGALSMAAGEYVSVSSQRDAESADLAREAQELADDPHSELKELEAMIRARGVPEHLANEVAQAMTAHDALAAHAHVELGIDPDALARPGQAALVSAGSFSVGAAIPLLTIVLSANSLRLWLTLGSALIVLAGLGAWSAHLGSAPVRRAVIRVVIGGALAMGTTLTLGHLFGGAVG